MLLVANLNIHLPSEPEVRTEPRTRWWRLRTANCNELRRRVRETGFPDPTGPSNKTWLRVTQTILRCAKETLDKAKGGIKRDKVAWFWNKEVQVAVRKKEEDYKLWGETGRPYIPQPTGSWTGWQKQPQRRPRTSVEVKQWWEEYFRELVNEEFPSREAQGEQPPR